VAPSIEKRTQETAVAKRARDDAEIERTDKFKANKKWVSLLSEKFLSFTKLCSK